MRKKYTVQLGENELVLKASASLKFTVLNPKGHIWTMVAGGGASATYVDTVGDLGYASEPGNYAEYSGAPNEEEVLQYARVVIDVYFGQNLVWNWMDSSIKGSGKTINVGDPVYILGNVSSTEEAAA
ncbi:ATP-citrate synthase alpha chain protein 3 [Glycine soja]|nr:hypothetical protein JHK87_053279 [Glycine soja]KHN34634.1 ATP-citrate synthase alpha chain protein 3 [Glycine soja]